MRADIRIAGLPTQVESRTRLAAQLIAAFGIDAKVSAWDGTRCHALVADAEDAYGARTIELAVRRSIPVVALSASGTIGPDHVCTAERGQPAASLAKVLAKCLDRELPQKGDMASAVPDAETSAAHDSGVLQLASTPALQQGDIVGRIDGLVVLLRRDASRVFAASRDVLLAARDRLAQAGWNFGMASNESAESLRALSGYSMALDAFCVSGARAADAAFPPLTSEPFQLLDWPDLGTAGVPATWLNVVGLLQRKPRTPQELVKRSGLEANEVHALVWALRASGVLVPCADALPAGQVLSPSPDGERMAGAQAVSPGLLSKLMRRFGFVPATAA